MDKIQLSQFGILPAAEPKYYQVGEVTFEVMPRLPYEEVLDGIQWAINFIIADRPYISEPLYEIMRDMALVRSYSNIDLDRIFALDFSARELYEMYDLLTGHGIIKMVKANIDEEQRDFFERTLIKTIHSMVAYKNSAAGIIETISDTSENSSAKIDKALDILKNEGNMDLISRFIEAYQEDTTGKIEMMPNHDLQMERFKNSHPVPPATPEADPTAIADTGKTGQVVVGGILIE